MDDLRRAVPIPEAGYADDVAVRVARTEIARMFARSAHFGRGSIDGPIWNILMFLVVARHRNTTIGEICGAGDAPKTTCLRHLEKLAERGWVEFAADSADRRSRFARLTTEGARITMSYLKIMAKLDD